MSTGFIDWTEKALTLFVFDRKGGEYTLTDSSTISIDREPDPTALAGLIKPGIRDIYLSIPLELLTLREQKFPFDDKDKIRDTIAFELEGVLLGSTEDYSIDHIITGSLDTGANALAVCIEKNKLREIIELFSSAGLDPRAVTSLDVCMNSGKTEELFEKTISDPAARAEAAARELPSPQLDLRREEMEYTGDIEKLKRSLRFTALLVLVLMVVLGLNISISLRAAKNEHSILKASTENAFRAVFPEDRKLIDIERQFSGNIKELEQKKAVLTGIPVLDLLRTIASLNKENIRLNEFSADGNKVIIKGTAVTFEDVDTLKDSLSRKFHGTKVIDSDALTDKKVGFTIIMEGEMR